MLDKILAFLTSHDLCVLATAAGGVPHCSLMAYVIIPGGDICMATLPQTRKWSNLQENPEVSLLMDNRERSPELGRDGLTAVTVAGRHVPFPDPADEASVIGLVAARHGPLGGVLTRPETRIIRVRPASYQILEGPMRSQTVAAAP